MVGETPVCVIGNLTDDPELRFTPSGAGVSNFTVASTPRMFDKQANDWKDGDTLFMRCAVWRQAAENVAESLRKGDRVIVWGRLKQRSYENREGVNVTVVECDVEEVGPSLKFRTVRHGEKAARSSGGGSDPWTGAPASPKDDSEPPF